MPRIALLLFLAVLVTGAIAVSGTEATSAGKVRVVIEESGSVPTLQGRFVLYGPASTDSGTSTIQYRVGPVRYREGQRYEIHSGVDTMRSKKGGLTLTFTGPSVNAGPSLYVEYGTWHISRASGIYKSWKGGGNWAGTDNEQTRHFQWEGLITR
jgi:hypothetical protein